LAEIDYEEKKKGVLFLARDSGPILFIPRRMLAFGVFKGFSQVIIC
jgi:hypothetical protein